MTSTVPRITEACVFTNCDKCGHYRATFHFEKIKPGKRPEDPPQVSTIHLCKPCAVKAGLMRRPDPQTPVPDYVETDLFEFGHASWQADALTDRCKTIILLAGAIAGQYDRDVFTAADLALALVREGTSTGLGELESLGVKLDQLERQLEPMLKSKAHRKEPAYTLEASLIEQSGLAQKLDGDHILLAMLRAGDSPLSICLKHQAMDPEIAYRSVRRRLHQMR